MVRNYGNGIIENKLKDEDKMVKLRELVRVDSSITKNYGDYLCVLEVHLEEEHFPKSCSSSHSSPKLLSRISQILTIEIQQYRYQINPHNILYKTHI